MTGGQRKKASSDALSWASWWYFNEDRFLRLRTRERRRRAETANVDLFLGADTSPTAINSLDRRKAREAIVPRLREALEDPYFDVRASAVIALAKCGAKSARLDITRMLADKDRRVRESACLALGILGEKEAVPILVAIMRDRPEARKRMGRPGREIIVRTRAFAAISLGLIGARPRQSIGAAAVTALREQISDKASKAQVDLAVAPIAALGIMRASDQVPFLISILDDARRAGVARAYAVTALGKIGDPAARDRVFVALKDRDGSVRRAAAIALGGIVKPWDKEASRRLFTFARAGSDIGARCQAILSLGRIGGEENRNLLFGFLKGNLRERNFASLALGVYFYDHPEDPHRGEVAGELEKLLGKTKNPDARGALGIGMGLMRHQRVAPALMKIMARGGPADLRSHLCLAIGLLEHDDAIPEVRDLVHDKGDIRLRRNAALTLGLVGDPGAMAFLREEIKESSNSQAVLGAVTRGLGLIGDSSAVPVLAEMATDRKKFKRVTRAFATAALGLLGDKDDVPVLSLISRNENYFARTDAISELLTIL